MKKSDVIQSIEGFRELKIGVLGDLIVDEYIFGSSSRVSREAPVLILKFSNRKIVPGGGGNCASNLSAMGANVLYFGIADENSYSDETIKIMEDSGIRTKYIIRDDSFITPLKTRILAGGAHTSKQQVLRLDKEKKNQPVKKLQDKLYESIKSEISKFDGIIISDYGLGTVTKNLAKKVIDLCNDYGKIITVDSRYDLMNFRNITLTTPNEWEVREIYRKDIKTNEEIVKYGWDLKKRVASTYLIITQGSSGMMVFGEEAHKIDVVGSDEVADVTGCGDTVIAASTLAISKGLSLLTAGRIANYAAGIAVNKRGTAAVSSSELIKSIQLYWKFESCNK